MTKTIIIDGQAVEFKASAAIPRLYRVKFHRDILQDLDKLRNAYIDNQTAGKEFAAIDLEVFENVTWIMAKHANPDVPDIDEWFEQFNMFSIYEIMPQVLELWAINEQTQIESKKKLIQLNAK